MSASEDDIRECFCHQIRFEVGLINELADMRMNGCEPPLDAAVVAAAARRTEIRRALELVREDGCWLLAWLLNRYLSTVRPGTGRTR